MSKKDLVKMLIDFHKKRLDDLNDNSDISDDDCNDNEYDDNELEFTEEGKNLLKKIDHYNIKRSCDENIYIFRKQKPDRKRDK